MKGKQNLNLAGNIYYHFLSSTHAIHDLESKMIRISTIDSLNDPFELLPHLRYLSKTEVDSYKRVRDRISDKYGLLCFSETWEEPLLWSHYADKHKGLALGFEVPQHQILKVEYTSDPIRTQLKLTNNPQVDENKFLNLATIKYKKWEYEKEYRMLVKLTDCLQINNNYFIRFDHQLRAKKIVLGARFNYEGNSLKYIFELAKTHNAKIVPTRLQREGYKINIDGRKNNELKKKLR